MRDRFPDLVYRLLLLAFPRRFRRAFGVDMRALFHEHRRAARGWRAALSRLWLAAIGDALFHGFAERVSELANLPLRTYFSLRPSHFTLGSRSTMRAFKQDVKYAIRLLIRQPGLTAIAVITLALGIGANAAMFSAVDTVLLRPLPWPDPDRLVMIWEKRPREGVMNNVVAPADFLDWSRRNTVFSAITGQTTGTADLTGQGEPVRLVAGAVSAAFPAVFGARLVEGRWFMPDEEVVGKHRVVVLGHALWSERFGSDRGIVGRRLVLNGVPHDVLGVLAPFEFPVPEVQLWTPLALEGDREPPPRANHFVNVYARLKPGVTLDRARTEMHGLGEQLSREYPATNRLHGAHVVPLRDELAQPARSGLLVLLAAVGFVLLIACVNVANLLLARAASRRREVAVRAALGASRARLAAQALVESLTLAVAGGIAGLFVAWWVVAVLPAIVPPGLQVYGLHAVAVDARVVVFALALTLLTGVLFGFLPAWQLARQEASHGLRDGGRSITPGGRRLRVGLVVAEVALAALLLVGAGLALRSFRTIVATEPGFQVEGRLTAFISLPRARYPERDRQVAAFIAIEERLAAIPGVRSVGATSLLPMSAMNARSGVVIQGREPVGDAPTRAHPRGVTPGYFQTMGIRVVGGREFTVRDDDRAPLVAVVNEEAVRRYWPRTSPIGARVQFAGEDNWREVVGIVADVRHWGLTSAVQPELYLPIRQRQYPWGGLVFVVAGSGGAPSQAADIRTAVRAVDPDLVVSRVRTLEEVTAASVARERAAMMFLAAFGAVALVLAAAGIYGVMSHLVTMRTSEIGVRMTLGAQPRDVLRQILSEAIVQTAIGLTIGLLGAVALMRSLRAMLHEVSPADPITLAGVAVVLLASAVLACYVPARRAMQVDPVRALRAE